MSNTKKTYVIVDTWGDTHGAATSPEELAELLKEEARVGDLRVQTWKGREREIEIPAQTFLNLHGSGLTPTD